MLLDALKRPIKDLRISVTDRCNFRCSYCMPLDEYQWINKKEILTFEEIQRLATVFVGLGVEKIRLTGGEPLVRQNLDKLVAKLSAIDGLTDLCLTTNGALLAEKVAALKAAGLRRVNISLDSLDPEKFRKMTKRGDLSKVLEGIFAAKDHGLNPIKLNAVIERGLNEDDVLRLVEFCEKTALPYVLSNTWTWEILTTGLPESSFPRKRSLRRYILDIHSKKSAVLGEPRLQWITSLSMGVVISV